MIAQESRMRLLMVGGEGRLARRLAGRLLGEHELLLLDADAPIGAAQVAGDPRDAEGMRAAADGAQILVLDGRGLIGARGVAALAPTTAAVVAAARADRQLRVVALSCARTATLPAALRARSPALEALVDMERALLAASLPLTLLCPAPLLGPGAHGPAVDRLIRPAPVDRSRPPCRFSFVDLRDVEGAMVSALYRAPAGRLDLGAPSVSLRAFDRRAATLGPLRAPVDADDAPPLGLLDEIVDAGPAAHAIGFWTRPRARTLRETAAWLGRRVD